MFVLTTENSKASLGLDPLCLACCVFSVKLSWWPPLLCAKGF